MFIKQTGTTPKNNTKQQQKVIMINWGSSDPHHTPPGARTWTSPPYFRPLNTQLGTSPGTVPETGARKEM